MNGTSYVVILFMMNFLRCMCVVTTGWLPPEDGGGRAADGRQSPEGGSGENRQAPEEVWLF